eukprot:SAG11_NODE_45_length_20574_cov_8.004054_4_plen_234_part_00
MLLASGADVCIVSSQPRALPHAGRLLKVEQAELHALMRAPQPDIVAVQRKVSEHSATSHEPLQREVAAIRRHAHKLATGLLANLVTLRTSINVVAMTAAIEENTPLLKLMESDPDSEAPLLRQELEALKERRAELVRRSQPAHEVETARTSVAQGDGRFPLGDGAAVRGLAEAAAAARAAIVRLLGSSDVDAIDEALDRYGYLGGNGGGELSVRSQHRCLPRDSTLTPWRIRW